MATGRFQEVFVQFLKLGLTSFGGPIAHIGYFRRRFIEELRWVDDRTFAELLALANLMPGPSSSQMGMAIGFHRAGWPGVAAAWLAFTLPSAFLLILFALGASQILESDIDWLHGFKLVVVAVVAQAVFDMAQKLCPTWKHAAIAVAGAVLALLLGGPFSQLAVLALGALLGLAFLQHGQESDAPAPDAGRMTTRLGLVLIAIFALLLLALPVLALGGSEVLGLLSGLYRSGALVFGGGHLVLPLLAETTVQPGFIDQDIFLAGYGAAQFVPGPLFSFAAYLGFTNTTALSGLFGAMVCLVMLFIPSVLLMFGVLPFWSKLRANLRARKAIDGVCAAVVGLLAAALIDPIMPSAIHSWLDIFVAGLAFALLMSKRLPVLAVIAGCAVLGIFIEIAPITAPVAG
ncbi:MAG: chromate efflux transporter [Geminicoccaceae bacterium]